GVQYRHPIDFRSEAIKDDGWAASGKRVPAAGPAIRGRLLPGRLRNQRRTGAVTIQRGDGLELAVLPLADHPAAAVDLILQRDLADDGVEGAAAYLLRDRLAVEGAGPFDGLLQHLQAGVGDRAQPAIR